MEKLFSKDNGKVRSEQCNFRVSKSEKLTLHLMLGRDLGDFLRGRVFSSYEYLKFCHAMMIEKNTVLEEYLVDLKEMTYEDLVSKYDEDFDIAWASQFLVSSIAEDMNYYNANGEVREHLIAYVTSQHEHYAKLWKYQYENVYLNIQAERIKEEKMFESLPKPTFMK